MFGAPKLNRFRSLASLILVVNVVGELQRKRTLAASCGFLAAARLSCYLSVSFIWLRIRLKLLLTRVNTILTFMVRTVLLVNICFNSLKLKLGYDPKKGYNRVKSILTFT